ncbi:MAG: class II aldolase/adducin family protein [Deltaproteobacteria bacterium]|nr:class II aldolase/adducin family protein [Deltaproteobacteria bacterium]
MAKGTETRLRRDLVEVCRRLHDRRLIGAGEGNVSCRLGPQRLLVTPSGANKGYLRPADLVVVDLAGRKLGGSGRPSTELLMHLAAYAARPDVLAVVHAHPLTAVAFTVAGVAPPNDLLPEAVLVLGRIAVAPFATPGTGEVPRSLAPFWKDHQVILLERHGALALGPDLFQAFDRMETLERVCQVAAAARALGRCDPLPGAAVAKVISAGRSLRADSRRPR